MRICRFNQGRVGLVEGDTVLDVTDALSVLPAQHWPYPTHDLLIANLAQFCARAEEIKTTAARLPLASVALDSAVANPPKVIAGLANFPEHLAATGWKPGEKGVIPKFSTSLAAPSAGVRLRFPDRTTVHETELVVVIGKSGTDISESDALGYVAGYCVGLDITLRGDEMPGLLKSIDTYTILGPWLVTADEIADPNALNITLKVNGELRQSESTSRCVFNVQKMISFVSQYMTLHPGDVIFMGNPPGAGPLNPGDTMVAAIETIGEMTVGVSGHPSS